MNEAERIIKTLGTYRSKRSLYEPDWRDCFAMTFPERMHGLSGEVTDSTSTRGKVAARLDSTGTDSSRILASALMSGMTPANSRWFAMDVGKETDEERRWLDQSADTIWENIHAANFDAAGFECMLDVVPAGWCVLFIDVNEALGGGYLFEQWPIAECYVASTRADGRINIIYREYCLPAARAAESFGLDNLSEKAQAKVRDKPADLIKFVRVIEPRTGKPGKLSRNLPFSCVDVEVDGKHIVREKGFHEFPCAVPRWTMIPSSSYAMGPVFHALPDMLELNELVRLEKAAADLAVSGMWIAEDDGVLNPRTVKVGPRKIIIANSVDSMKELKSGADFNVSFTMKSQLQAQIRRAMMADQLQPQDGPAMTATEVHVRVGLIRQMLGPVYGRMQSEWLQTIIERCFGLAFRSGALEPPPESLANREFHIRYISPLARAQRLEDVTAMDRLENGLLTKAQAKPELLDIYDFEEAENLRAQFLGVPSKVMRTDKQIQALRDERAAQAQQQQAQQQQAAMAQAVGANDSGAQVMGALMAA